MNDKLLLDRRKQVIDYGGVGHVVFDEGDVLECLKKFKGAILFKGYEGNDCDICGKRIRLGYAVITSGGRTDEFYCKTCWFEECFGELPKKECE